MKKIFTIIRAVLIVCLYNNANAQCNTNHTRSILIPHQLSYNVILENAFTLHEKLNESWHVLFSAKPIYTQSAGSTLATYFTIDNKCSLNVEEDGSGDVNPLWFNVISSDNTFYRSKLSFNPKRQTYGALLYCAAQLSCKVQLAVTTAIVKTKNNMNICERVIGSRGTCSGYTTVAQSFANSSRLFGRIAGPQTKTGFDDVQVKLLYNFYKSETLYWDIYGLVGIPTGTGSKARYVMEPLVGSNHAQLGFGLTNQWVIRENYNGVWSLQGEIKYRYGLSAQERRSFDLTDNGQWSRYLLFVNEADKYAYYPAINSLTFKTNVTPRSSFDLYLATHVNHKAWQFEAGYDLWYRSAEKISFCCTKLSHIGIADLKGIAAENPETAHTATIWQGIQSGPNQMVSDTSFQPVTTSQINPTTGAQAGMLSHSFHGSIGYTFDIRCHPVQFGLHGMYEHGAFLNTPDNVTTWASLDFCF